MKPPFPRIALIALLGTGTATAAGPALAPADLARIAAPYVQHRDISGASLGILQDASAVSTHVGAVGTEPGLSADDTTVYEIGSITKVFTSLLLAEAVVRGEVTLDTPIAGLLPPDVVLPEGAGDTITLRMLATHTSGLPRIPVEIPPDNPENPYASFDDTALWSSLRRVRLDFEPGTRASYSNLAAGLLGTLLARRAGVSYPELLAARITGPLGMEHTTVGVTGSPRDHLAIGRNGSGQPWSPWEFQALAGAGGIRSTIGDMLRFARAMLQPEGTPLREAIALTWERQALKATVAPGGQGLGWMIAGDGQTRWHNGMTGGFHAALFVNRKLGVASVVLVNRAAPAGSELAEHLLRAAAGLPERQPPNRDRAEIVVPVEQLERCVGTFRLNESFALVFEVRDGVLLLMPTGQGTDRLFAESPAVFFSRRVPADLVFEFPSKGDPASAVVLRQGGREMRAPREIPAGATPAQ
ncbi:MAG: beta-lactamase family protein [Opitutaceae bacterium]|nr:beta-lactamase family protein [Opitutaceae bacterium]